MTLEGRLVRLLYGLLWYGRWPLLGLLLTLTLLLAVPAAQVQVEQDNASMASLDAESQARYRAFRDAFGDDNLLLLGLRDPQLLTASGLARLQRLTGRIAALPGVASVYSLSNAVLPVPGPFGAQAAPLLPAGRSGAELADLLAAHPDLARRLLSADRQTAALLVQPQPLAGAGWGQLIDALRALQTDLPPGVALRLSGVPVQKVAVARAIQRDQKLLIPLSVVVLAGLLALIFRRLSGVLLPLLVMGISLVWTLGLYALAGLSLNTITALLPPVVMVLAVATTVHIYHAWLELAGEKGEPRTLLAHATARIFLPCLLTALTTAIGLASLAICDIPAVRGFGLFAACGVLCAFAVAITLVPTLLSLLALPGQRQRRRNRPLRNGLRLATRLVLGRPKLVLGMTLLLTLAALPPLGRIGNNTDLVRFFREEAPLYRDTLALDAELGGVESLELVISAPAGASLLEPRSLAALAALERDLRARPEVTGSFSLLDLLRPLQQVVAGADGPALPNERAGLLDLYDLLLAAGDPQLLGRVITSDLRQLRLSVQLHAIGSAPTARLAADLLATGRSLLGPGLQLQATGNYLLLSDDSNRLVSILLRSFGLSLALILLALLLLFRSWRLLLVALAPNLVPLLWTAGVMGWCGIDLSTGTAMIAAVTIGLVVDDTIHFLHRYRREHAGYTRPALVRAALGVGPALLISTLVLSCGFWVGAFGSFRPTAYFSLLTGGTLVGALLCDLLVLPAGLLLLEQRAGWKLVPALALLALLAAPPPPLQAAGSPAAAEVIREAPIPRDPPEVGRLRLLRRADALLVVTELSTPILRRVVAAIGEKEKRRWPPGNRGRGDMESYLAALATATETLEARIAALPPGSDRTRRLRIAFIAGSGAPRIELTTPAAEGGEELLQQLRVARHYLAGELRAITAENFGLSEAEADTLLRRHLPAGVTLPEPTP